MTVRLMSDGELTRLEVLRDLDQRRLTTAASTQLLGLEPRPAKQDVDQNRQPDTRLPRCAKALAPTEGAVSKLLVHRALVGRCATPRAPRPPAAQPRHRAVTFVNGRDGDICIWWTHTCPTDHPDVVPIRIDQESAVIIKCILGAVSRRTIVVPAISEAGGVKPFDRGEADMEPVARSDGARLIVRYIHHEELAG